MPKAAPGPKAQVGETLEQAQEGQVSVRVTLASDGYLAIWLSDNRLLPMRGAEVAATLIRVLEGQIARRDRIGQDGAPTKAQVRHWERHQIFPDPRCAFCRAEQALRKELLARFLAEGLPAGVQVKKVAKATLVTTKSAEELGL